MTRDLILCVCVRASGHGECFSVNREIITWVGHCTFQAYYLLCRKKGICKTGPWIWTHTQAPEELKQHPKRTINSRRVSTGLGICFNMNNKHVDWESIHTETCFAVNVKKVSYWCFVQTIFVQAIFLNCVPEWINLKTTFLAFLYVYRQSIYFSWKMMSFPNVCIQGARLRLSGLSWL